MASTISKFKLRVLIQKTIFRVFFLFSFLLFLGIFAYAFHTDLNLKEVTGEAPFIGTLRAKNDINKPVQFSLEKPHRTPRELERWVSQSISEVFMLDGENYAQQVEMSRKYFSPEGHKQYKAYLESADLKNILEKNDLKASIFVEQKPLLLNDGSVGGVYRWLYEVPVTVSYVARASRAYKPGDIGVNRKVKVHLQIRRSASSDSLDGLQIESWTVLPRRK